MVALERECYRCRAVGRERPAAESLGRIPRNGVYFFLSRFTRIGSARESTFVVKTSFPWIRNVNTNIRYFNDATRRGYDSGRVKWILRKILFSFITRWRVYRSNNSTDHFADDFAFLIRDNYFRKNYCAIPFYLSLGIRRNVIFFSSVLKRNFINEKCEMCFGWYRLF